MHFSREEHTAERIVGLAFGEHSASASLLSFGSGESVKLKAAGTINFDPEFDVKQVSGAIRKLWKDNHFRTVTVCAGIQSSSLLFKTFSYPELSDGELAAAIRLDAEELLQAKQDSLCMDTHLYNTGKPERRGFYVAVPKQEVEKLRSILRAAGLFPVIVDLSSMAAANLFLKLKSDEAEGRTVCVACFDGHHTDIVVLSDGECTYMRSFAAHSTDTSHIYTYMLENLKEVVSYSEVALQGNRIETIYLAGDIPQSGSISADCRAETGISTKIWDPLSTMHISHRLASRWRHTGEPGKGLVRSLGLALRRSG
jgi:Tfp pilus assembly PilM family ATPase